MPEFEVFSEQIRAARALVRMSQDELVELSGVSIATIRRLEARDGPLPKRSSSGEKIIEVLEGAGVVFTPSDKQKGQGVRLAKLGQSPSAWRQNL